jgi:purine-nucleoside phosphorylase
MSTPHINAEPGDFAPSVLLPGDPLRAEHIARTFLDDVRQVNDVRNMLGFTGTYEGLEVSVMGSGMGIPSASIYATELVKDFGVEHLVRVGSCGAVQPDLALRDVVIAAGACTDSGVNRSRYGGMDFAAIADPQLLVAAIQAAQDVDLDVTVGNLHSADLFYVPAPAVFSTMRSMGVLAVEMEAAGLYGLAAEHGAKALAICTVSDHILDEESTSAEERETTFDDMVRLALEAVRLVRT